MRWNWHSSEPIPVYADTEAHSSGERGTEEPPRLSEYTTLFAVVSVWYERFDQHLRTRSGRACADRAKACIEQATDQRRNGGIDLAIACLYHAAVSIKQGDVLEETFGPRLEQLWHGYGVVAQGVEAGSEAHACLERFVVAIDLFNDATMQNDTDDIVEKFDMAIDLLKGAALARHRR